MVPLGGVDIGASCLYCQTAHQGWILDSGVRFDERDPLPYFAWLETEQAPVDAIFVTHAHQDHTGTLPVLARLYPAIPISMTPATRDITRVMLRDAWRLADQGVGTRLFTEQDLDSLATRIHPMGQDQAMAWQDMRVSTFSAGHILGAVFSSSLSPCSLLYQKGPATLTPKTLTGRHAGPLIGLYSNMHPQISQVAGKRTALLVSFWSIITFSVSCSHQFYSVFSIRRVPPDLSGDACIQKEVVVGTNRPTKKGNAYAPPLTPLVIPNTSMTDM